MKIAEILRAGPSYSFEFFPPRTPQAEETLRRALVELEPLGPSFVSVTYGAGGTTREKTHDLVTGILTGTSMLAMAHLTCAAHTRAELTAIVERYAVAGVENILALGGDPPADLDLPPGELAYAVELVRLIRAIGDFSIGVAAHPEPHPRSPSRESDRLHTAEKLAEADFAITQFFFDNDLYERYVERVRRAGIYIPVVPGILPVHNFAQVANFSARCGALVPSWLAERFDGLDNDPQTHALVASAVAAEQVLDLVERGVHDFHFYTMNRADLVFAVCHMIGIRAHQRLEGSAAA